MKKAGIYKITNRGNNKVYIGSSVNLDNRKRQHFYLLSKNNHTNRYLQYAYNLHGGENFKWEIIEYVEKLESLEEVKKKLLEREQHWLDLFFGEDCYNFNPTAGSNLGIKLSKETRIRIGRANSIALRGRKLPQDVIEKIRLGNLGKKMSPESIEKTRQANLGKILSEETKKKMSEKLKGNTHTLGHVLSEEHKRKIGEKSKRNKYALGNKLSEEHKEKIRQANLGNTHTLGRKLSEEHKEKIRLGNLGKKMSPESIEKTRQANIGKKLSEEHKRKIGEKSKGRTSKKVINLDTNVVFNNITEASLFYNLDITSIVKVCKGKRKTCGGFRWSYLD